MWAGRGGAEGLSRSRPRTWGRDAVPGGPQAAGLGTGWLPNE